MRDIVLSHVSKTYPNGVEAIRDLSLKIPYPTLAVIVGPSGCGKTTVLRLVAGLEKLSSGEIYVGGKRIDTIEPRERDVAMVFQSYALFPHMTVRQNLSFGPGLRRISKEKIRERVERLAKELGLSELLERRPSELSGGQRQRVALGRAVIRDPSVYLFDEPLSNLDAKLRAEMRYMIKKLYQDTETTAIYVTHDQLEAMTMGEMLIVLEGGRIHQVGSPHQCYNHPRDTFVATFLGSPSMNLVDAAFDDSSGKLVLGNAHIDLPPELCRRLNGLGKRSFKLGFRPENLAVSSDVGAAEKLVLQGKVILCEPLGFERIYHLEVCGHRVMARIRDEGTRAMEGDVELCIEHSKLVFFSTSDGSNLEEKAGE